MDEEREVSRHSYWSRCSPAYNYSFSHQEGNKIAQGENVGILSKHWASTTGIDPFC